MRIVPASLREQTGTTCHNHTLAGVKLSDVDDGVCRYSFLGCCIQYRPSDQAPHDFLCPICLELLWKPVVLECGHAFCFWCVFRSMNRYDMSKCPMCKSGYESFPPVCLPVHRYLQTNFPETSAERTREIAKFEQARDTSSPSETLICMAETGGVSVTTIPPLARKLRQALLTSTRVPTLPRASETCLTAAGGGLKEEASKTNEINFSLAAQNCPNVNVQHAQRFRGGNWGAVTQGIPLELPGLLRNNGDEPAASIHDDDPQESTAYVELPISQTTGRDAGVEDIDQQSETPDPFSLMDGEFVHYHIWCDGCGKLPIKGRRYNCNDCERPYNLCGVCYDAGFDKPGRFNQGHTAVHDLTEIGFSDSEKWMQTLNRMKAIHPELSVEEILQWIFMHYQDMLLAAGNTPTVADDEVASFPSSSNMVAPSIP
eukprot:GHVT01038933.1.p1 GENE.GHVT01038933.1~~GHVT01038933.1.p1  ORF type:complete len:429 (+),score=23.07 GHVT01038933.1:193-1479(+)